MAVTDTGDLVVRHPLASDAQGAHDLVRRTPSLDLNSIYHYALWFTDWSTHSAVAVEKNRIVGLLTGFIRPTDPTSYFAWQTCVDAGARSADIGFKLYDYVLARPATAEVRKLQMTVSPQGRSIRFLLGRLARRYDSSWVESPMFAGALLGEGHDDELLQTLDLGPQSARIA